VWNGKLWKAACLVRLCPAWWDARILFRMCTLAHMHFRSHALAHMYAYIFACLLTHMHRYTYAHTHACTQNTRTCMRRYARPPDIGTHIAWSFLSTFHHDWALATFVTPGMYSSAKPFVCATCIIGNHSLLRRIQSLRSRSSMPFWNTGQSPTVKRRWASHPTQWRSDQADCTCAAQMHDSC